MEGAEQTGGDPKLAGLAEVMAPFNGADLVEVFGDPERVEQMRSGLKRIADGGMVTEMIGADRGLTGTFVGVEGFIEGWSDFLAAFATFKNDLEGMVLSDDGDTVVMLGRQRATTATAGVGLDNEAAAVFRFEGDRLVRAEFHLDREAGGRAAGIDPERMRPDG